MRGSISTVLKLLLLLLYVVSAYGAPVEYPLRELVETCAEHRARELSGTTWTQRAQGVIFALTNDTRTYFNSSRKLFQVLYPTADDRKRGTEILKKATLKSKDLIVHGARLVVELRSTYARECKKGMKECVERATSAILDRAMAVGDDGTSSHRAESSVSANHHHHAGLVEEESDELDDDIVVVDVPITDPNSEDTPQQARTLLSIHEAEDVPAGEEVEGEDSIQVEPFIPEVDFVDDVHHA